ncbi:glycosyltransferase family 4 protein [Priestia megaterium]|uniref:Glycosyl transferases group 1 family protein n=1 Tax=Priestia megaterium (strain ATCC 14581 / DSM 32 / CCUG 1817 / JCM 2506 / NBRC 15308 / NCIMB 9376 / NCTC 10342 / NRRL B-14308 / VKM B-512 / Ford 19) TaxID=1348623 RepID=A0A0B6APD5_PRIM2|nr:glycosyltransferase family 4 protein [Priestia megaterium]AJI25351.1 glycosyl transferases group 1 family protein [Priestia megaterium NBRC 15308 = ATCC 14581]KFM96464.1 glycosyl transferases group 1 family protein [Priestia megaterium]KGJ85379.1 hypothetical protein BMT_28165 [Priestia megaterium NBRC 15308 = ATCC 14581]MDR4233401.1 glycosyltransferase family 4 protein [Priestia megaterium]MED3807089.1 glycosyltransferase family 4 protein [Priestia megaterium]
MKNKLKILYIHHGASQGGAPRSLSFLIEKLDKKIFEPIVICMSDKRNIELFEKVGARVIFDDRLGAFHGSEVTGMSLGLFYHNIKTIIPTYKYIKKYIRNIQPDIVHLNSTCLFIAARAIKKYNSHIPVVCHVREPLLNNMFGDILKIMNRKYVNFFIAIDKFDAKTIDVSNDKLEVIYNFVDMNVYNSDILSDDLRKEFNIRENSLIFLSLARVIPQNGVKEAIEAIRDHIDEEDQLHFFFVGDNLEDNSKYAVEIREEASMLDHVHILPFRDDVVQLIASADVMVAPFTRPHFARSIIEAASMGKPSIGTDIGGPQELIVDKKTGLLFNVNEFLEFIECCKRMKNKELRLQMGENAKEFAKENFSADTNVNKTIQVYYKLLKGSI